MAGPEPRGNSEGEGTVCLGLYGPDRGERVMILLRRELGDVLRAHRLRQGRTLREVSATARVSLGYLSEVERGQKEASSELLAAICDALGVRLSVLLHEVGDGVARQEPELTTAPSVAAA